MNETRVMTRRKFVQSLGVGVLPAGVVPLTFSGCAGRLPAGHRKKTDIRIEDLPSITTSRSIVPRWVLRAP